MNILWLGWRELYTARRIREAAEAQGVGLTVAEIFDLTFVAAGPRTGLFMGAADVLAAYDALIMRTFHPYIAEGLTVARLFREAGRAVVDESLTSEGYAISKMHDTLVLARAGLPVPRTWQIFDPAAVETLAAEIGYPVILKGVQGSHGTQVHIAHDAGGLRRRLWTRPAGELTLQEYLPADEDYRVITVGYRALPVLVSRRPAPGDFRTNFAAGGEFRVRTFEEFPALRELGERAARALRREFAAVDIRYRGDAPLILEVNRRPDFEGFEGASGYDVAGALLRYVRRKAGDEAVS